MKYLTSPLYQKLPSDLEDKLKSAVNAGLKKTTGNVRIFFRADDIGVPSQSFTKMAELFTKYRVPLCLAVVPTWLTRSRFTILKNSADSHELFCWHQHGWRHRNHESSGKKQEFSDNREAALIHSDLQRGCSRLRELMGDDFFPFFTPPWNRCEKTALTLLKKLNFKGISRSPGASPPPPQVLPDIPVNVDLHTRKEADPAASLKSLLKELELSFTSQTSGIMLHHQRMNDNSFLLLELLLKNISGSDKIQRVHFRDMLT